MDAKEKKELLVKIVFAIVGGGISALSFFLYHSFSQAFLTILICILDVVYAYFNAKLFFKSKDWNGARQFIIPLLLLGYYGIVFAVVSIGNAFLVGGEFQNHFLLYPIFLMPAFVLTILALCLIAAGM